jgi:histidine triad (HIT) family protein
VNCIFCDILSGKRDGHIIYEDKLHIVFLDKYPIDTGHSLVIPREHHEKITDMSSSAVGEMFSIVPKIAKGILDATGADAFSLGQNDGRAEKQIIHHVHIHSSPRYNRKGTVWTKRAIEDDSELLTLAEKIKKSIT